MDIDFETPRVVLCIGKPKKGKSNAIKYWILKNTIDNKIFKFGIVFSRTGRLGDEYDYIPNKYVFTGYDENVLDRYIKLLEGHIKENKEPTPNFVIFDDLLGLLNKNDKFLMNFLAIHRHLGCSVFLAFQHLNYGSSTAMREICTNALLFSSKSFNTLKSLYENFGTLYPNYPTFKKSFFDITATPFHGMLYYQDIEDVDDNYLDFSAPDMTEYKYKLKY